MGTDSLKPHEVFTAPRAGIFAPIEAQVRDRRAQQVASSKVSCSHGERGHRPAAGSVLPSMPEFIHLTKGGVEARPGGNGKHRRTQVMQGLAGGEDPEPRGCRNERMSFPARECYVGRPRRGGCPHHRCVIPRGEMLRGLGGRSHSRKGRKLHLLPAKGRVDVMMGIVSTRRGYGVSSSTCDAFTEGSGECADFPTGAKRNPRLRLE